MYQALFEDLQTLSNLILKKEPNKVGDTDEDIEAHVEPLYNSKPCYVLLHKA